MRHYPTNSPDAAGRILAACLLTDGHISLIELETLDRCGMERRLLLNRHRLLAIVRTLYEDLTHCGYLSWNDVCHVDPETLAWLAADVQDRQLRRDILDLCNEAVNADRNHCDREADFLRLLREAWKLPVRSDATAESGGRARVFQNRQL
ncbi:TerB family tellurite resistance protein [Paraburkholderia sp. DHOC27]|uniref:TerB family tellurite resistance protein n=1 Tax=Paraburkholderia sp. DHOC27 TaxID=2303330 RepID=UPI0015F31E87|nr:TerB family tellurite resistance protein [Paraburkholderia sp. DHOC27]